LEYKIQTLQGEIITQREYLGRLEEKISALERSDATHIGQLGAIGTQLDPIISEVENLLSHIGHESELFAELNSFLERLRRLKKQTFPTPIYVPVYN
jgi:chromosome segregation ATPase